MKDFIENTQYLRKESALELILSNLSLTSDSLPKTLNSLQVIAKDFTFIFACWNLDLHFGI